MNHVIDLRSDTLTTPTPEMRKAMAEAPVGDDGYGEDPTVNKLQELAAAMLGKEEALFFPSGTMANQAAIMAHTARGNEVILDANSHIFYSEAGGMAVLSGCHPRLFWSDKGRVTPEMVKALLRNPDNVHFPPTSLLCLENTHNRSGGTVMTAEETARVAQVAHEAGLKVHLDGARIFNAAVALGVSVQELVRPVDSVMFSLSKGLGAPVGSMLAGSREFIRKARRARKLLGGAMRQAGVIAAAGVVALETMIDRLHIDHENARRLAEGLADLPGLQVDLERVQTNIVMVDVTGTGLDAAEVARRWASAGVLVNAADQARVRCVTRKEISASDVDEAIVRISRALG